MRRAVLIGAALVLLLLCGGCAGAPETEPSAADPVPITAWPENDFTAGLPESGLGHGSGGTGSVQPVL